jgi:hypothetical protein
MAGGGLVFSFVRFVAKAFTALSKTKPPPAQIAGTRSSLAAIRGAEYLPKL